MKKVALYVRCSTGEQSTVMQQDRLKEVAARAGWEIVEIYEDAGFSGSRGRDKRPALDKLLKDAARRSFDVVMLWSVDRLSRSLQHLVTTMTELQELGVNLYIDRQSLDTTTPSGRAMWQMLGVFGELEKSLMIERVKAGMAKAKLHGTRSGRPLGQQNPLAPSQVRAIERSLFTDKLTLAEVVQRHKVSRTTAATIRRGKHAYSTPRGMA